MKFVRTAGRITVVSVVLGTLGCATLFSGSSAEVQISSTPVRAEVEIERQPDGPIVKAGTTPMTAKLPKGKEYAVTIRMDGYETQTVAIVKGGIEWTAFLNLGSLLGWVIDYATGSMFKLDPNSIHVQLKHLSSESGVAPGLYALMRFVDEDGKEHLAAVPMTRGNP